MADVSIIFKGSVNTSTEENQLEVFANMQNKVSITIFDPNFNQNGYPNVIQLNRETAIKFHRELKKQISFLESGVQDV